MGIIHAEDTAVKMMPGRSVQWYVGKEGAELSEYCACNVVVLEPGSVVRPAHSHAACEEFVYVVEGEGEIFMDGEVYPLKKDSAVLVRKEAVHMLHNSGTSQLKAVCFFAPPTTMEEYTFHPDVAFPGKE